MIWLAVRTSINGWSSQSSRGPRTRIFDPGSRASEWTPARRIQSNPRLRSTPRNTITWSAPSRVGSIRIIVPSIVARPSPVGSACDAMKCSEAVSAAGIRAPGFISGLLLTVSGVPGFLALPSALMIGSGASGMTSLRSDRKRGRESFFGLKDSRPLSRPGVSLYYSFCGFCFDNTIFG